MPKAKKTKLRWIAMNREDMSVRDSRVYLAGSEMYPTLYSTKKEALDNHEIAFSVRIPVEVPDNNDEDPNDNPCR